MAGVRNLSVKNGYVWVNQHPPEAMFESDRAISHTIKRTSQLDVEDITIAIRLRTPRNVSLTLGINFVSGRSNQLDLYIGIVDKLLKSDNNLLLGISEQFGQAILNQIIGGEVYELPSGRLEVSCGLVDPDADTKDIQFLIYILLHLCTNPSLIDQLQVGQNDLYAMYRSSFVAQQLGRAKRKKEQLRYQEFISNVSGLTVLEQYQDVIGKWTYGLPREIISRISTTKTELEMVDWVISILRSEQISGEYYLKFEMNGALPFWLKAHLSNQYEWVHLFWGVGGNTATLHFIPVELNKYIQISASGFGGGSLQNHYEDHFVAEKFIGDFRQYFK